MCKVVEGIIMNLITIVDIPQEILEVFLIDIITVIVLQSPHDLEH